jgi:hypothetical protein
VPPNAHWQVPGISFFVGVNHEVDSITYNDRVIMGKMVGRICTCMWAQNHGGGGSALIPYTHILKDFIFCIHGSLDL